MTVTTKPSNGQPRTGVLLIHGLCGSPAELRFIANGLARQGYDVRTPLLAGHGAGADELRASTWQDWLASARAALDDMARTCDEIVVGGLSTGALLALMLAAAEPRRVTRLVLYSPTIWLNGRKIPWTMRVARRCLAFRAVARHFDLPSPEQYGIKDERIRQFLAQARTKSGAGVGSTTPGVTALERRWLAREVLTRLATISQPALIIHPREDCLADLDNAFYLQRNLPGPSELVVLDDSYHLITIDRQRQEVLDTTVRYLAARPASRQALRRPEPRIASTHALALAPLPTAA